MKSLKYIIIFTCLFSTYLFGIGDTISITISIKDSTSTLITGNNIPKEFKLYPPYPNPFNPICTIQLDIPKNDNIDLTIYDIYGNNIYNIYKGTIIPGKYKFTWDASKFSSGIYLVRIIANQQYSTKKVVFLK